MRSVRLIAFLGSLALVLAATSTSVIAGTRNSGFYDNQVIEYVATTATDTPRTVQQLAKGNIVYHIVDANGNTPTVQCARLLAALPDDATACNVLNFIPTEVGYTGGAWNLQIFHWNPGFAVSALTKDDDITAAAAAGRGWIEVTNILVRCPIVNFAANR